MVQIHPDPPSSYITNWGRSSAGRAPALHAGGQEFDPPRLHHLVLGSFHMHAFAYGRCWKAIDCSSLIIQRLINYIDMFGVVSRIVIPNSLEFGLSNAGSSPLLTRESW